MKYKLELFNANWSYSYYLKIYFATYQRLRANRTSWAGTSNKDNLKYEASLSYSPTTKLYVSNRTDKHLPSDKTGIVDSGATHMYIAPNAPYEKMDETEKQIRLGTANGQVSSSTATATLSIPQLNADFPTKGYIMPTFTNTLIGVGPICDANCTVVF